MAVVVILVFVILMAVLLYVRIRYREGKHVCFAHMPQQMRAEESDMQKTRGD